MPSGNYPTSTAWPASYNWPTSAGWPTEFNGNFADLFPYAYQIWQNDQGLLYGAAPLATAGNTSTTVIALSGVISGTPVPIWWQANNNAAIGAGASFNIYYDGQGITPAMSGVIPAAGTPVALTGAASGLSATWTAGNAVNGNSWKATCAGVVDQSGNFYDYAQLELAKQPIITSGVGGKAGVLYDGVDDILVSNCSLPAPAVVPWCGFLIARRPTAAAGGARMLTDNTADVASLILTGATDIRLFCNGTFGPTGTGLPTNTWGAIDFMFSGSANDYIQTGSGPVARGAGAGSAVPPTRSISGAAAYGNFEVIAGGYVPAQYFDSVAFRRAVRSYCGSTVSI